MISIIQRSTPTTKDGFTSTEGILWRKENATKWSGYVLQNLGRKSFHHVIYVPSQRLFANHNSRPKIDVLANIAGVMDAFAAADVYTDKEWDRIMLINLTVPTRLMRAVLPLMKAKSSGSIINVCSKAAISGAAAGVAYTASKHGLVCLIKSCLGKGSS